MVNHGRRRKFKRKPSKLLEVFNDFKGRRAALIKALTTDSAELYQHCDPDHKEDQALFGFPDGHWEVKVPEEELPPNLPEPAIGINVGRDDIEFQEWLSDTAAFCDAWLLSVAFHCSANLKFTKADRQQLFTMINELPTVLEVVSGIVKEPVKVEKSLVPNNSNSHMTITPW